MLGQNICIFFGKLPIFKEAKTSPDTTNFKNLFAKCVPPQIFNERPDTSKSSNNKRNCFPQETTQKYF